MERETFLVDLFPEISGFAQGAERRLMAAILFDGIQGYLQYHLGRARSELRSDVAWLESSTVDYPFSFESCCEALGLDPSAVRRAVWSRANQSAGASWARGRRKF